MKKTLKKSIALLFVFVLVFSFAGCENDAVSDSKVFETLRTVETRISGPEKALENFEKAFNERDMEGIVKIFKPNLQSEIKLQKELAQGVAGFAGELFGLDGISDLLSDDIISGVFGVVLEDHYFDIQVINVTYNQRGNKATVIVKIVSEDEEETDKLEMIKISDVWYLDMDTVQ